MENGKDKPIELIVPAPVGTPEPAKICHIFFAPVVVPEPDRIKPGAFNVIPRMGNFPCMGVKCTLWNNDAHECWDVSAKRGQAQAGEYAYAKRNDVVIDTRGD